MFLSGPVILEETLTMWLICSVVVNLICKHHILTKNICYYKMTNCSETIEASSGSLGLPNEFKQ